MAATRTIAVLVLFSLFFSFPVGAAEISATDQIAGLPAEVQHPFIAEVTGNDVYVRSGKGTAYYACGKAYLGDRVTVVGRAFGWAEVVPPEGSFSWIHKNYVDVKPAQPTVGVLTGDNVRVWAGSDSIDSTRSTSMQTKLNTGEIVELFADQPIDGDYCKIKPPAGAKLTISCQFLKYVGPVESRAHIVLPPRDGSGAPVDFPPPTTTDTGVPSFGNLPDDRTPVTPKIVLDPNAVEKAVPAGEGSANLQACYALAEKIDQQRKKSMAEQNYNPIKMEIEKIKADTADSKASIYAQILMERIARYELAISVSNTLEKQDESLAQIKEKIEKARLAEMEKVHRSVDFIYSGVLKVSNVYTSESGRKRYMLQGPNGKILCYTIPVTKKAASQYEKLIGKRVGIQGEVSNDRKSIVPLVEATAVQPI